MNQQTLIKEYSFEGRGLHTGKYAHLTLKPAPAGSGIRFVRTDLDVEIGQEEGERYPSREYDEQVTRAVDEFNLEDNEYIDYYR